MTDNGLELACACAPELLIELHAAALNEQENFYRAAAIKRLANAVRACSAIVSELQAGLVVMVVASPPASASAEDCGPKSPLSESVVAPRTPPEAR